MFKFLCRDGSNIAKLQQLKQKSDAKQANAKRLSSAIKAAGLPDRKSSQYVSQKKMKMCQPSEIVGLMERAEVKAVVNKLVETVEAEYSAESAAKLVLARIIAKIEKSDPNFHRKQVQSTTRSVKSGKFKYLGRQVKPNLTWGEKANIIYFHLHPNLGSKNVDLTYVCTNLVVPLLKVSNNGSPSHGLDEFMWYPTFSMMSECVLHPC